MRIASLVAAVVISACRPAGVAPVTSGEAGDAAPALRLVRCAPALPLPRTAVDLAAAPPPGGDELGGLGAAAVAAPGPDRVPRVIAGSPTVTGPLDRVVVERMVRGRLPQLRACYERELAAVPAMTGTVTVSFVAGSDGRVAQTSVLGSGVSASVSACAVQVVQTLQFPTGQPLLVSYPFQFAPGGGEPELHAAPVRGPRAGAPWTPFALGDEAPPRSAALIARATEAAVRRGLPAIAGCFAGPAPRGSLRAMIAVRGDGAIDAARTGGLGDAAEACVARRLAELRVLTPGGEGAEIACDLARGEAGPWRVAPVAGYTVLEAGPRGVRHGDDVVTPGVVAPRPLAADQTFLIVASPDTPGAMIELALEWTEQGDATLLALRDGGPHAPLVIGVARTARQIGGAEPASLWPALRVSRGTLTACVDRASQRTALGDPGAVDGLVRRVAAHCRGQHCTASLGVTIDADATAAQLLDVAGAARRAGFERVLLGSYAGCAAARPSRS